MSIDPGGSFPFFLFNRRTKFNSRKYRLSFPCHAKVSPFVRPTFIECLLHVNAGIKLNEQGLPLQIGKSESGVRPATVKQSTSGSDVAVC